MSRPSAAARYRAVLSLPHALPLFGAAVLGRLSYGVLPLAMLLGLQHATGSFAGAGLADGGFGLGVVLLGPVRGRLIDRHGPRRALGPMAGTYAVLLALLALAVAHRGTPFAVLLAACTAAGCCAPPLGPTMRACWRRLAEGDLTPAFSLDSVVEEILFTVGPTLTGLIIALANPALAIVVSAALVATGAAGMLRSPVLAGWHADDPAAERPKTRLRPGFAPLLVIMVAVGAGMSAIELAAAGSAQRAGHSGVAGLLAAAISAASAVGGLGYGATAWRRPLHVRLTLLACGQAAVAVVLAAVSSGPVHGAAELWLLAAVLALFGLLLAPAMTTGYLVADHLVPAGAATAAATWVNTMMNAGSTLGGVVAGLAIDRAGPAAAFLVGAVGLAAAGAIGAARRRTIRGAPAIEAEPVSR